MSDASGPPAARARRVLVLAIGLGTLLNPLNSSLIAVALHDMQRDFRAGFDDVSWLVSAYYLGSAIGQPVMGRLGDLHGRRRVFVAGMLTVAAACVAAPFAPGLGSLIAIRVVQAVGGAALFPTGIGMLRDAAGSGATRSLGAISIFASVSAGIGPTLGAYLVGWQGWPTIFLANLPVIAVALVLAVRVLPAGGGTAKRGTTTLAALDLGGVAAFALAVFAALWFLLSLEHRPAWWAPPVALAAGAAFLRIERRAAQPFIDLRMLAATPTLLVVYAQFAAVNVVFYSIFFGIPSFLQAGLSFSVEKTGLVMLVVAGLGIVTTPIAARMVDRVGLRVPLLIGGTFMTAGSLLLLTIGAGTSVPWLVGVLAVFGVSTGFNSFVLQATMYRTAPAEQIGTASGLFMTARYLGTIGSASLLGVAFGRTIGVTQLHAAAVVLAVVSAGILLSTVRARTFATA
ncbi:MAG TPA: MFS transporter [Solirubrobacteraceae bacterium]